MTKKAYRRVPIDLPWELGGLSKGTPMLLAFSGGADSAALLQMLAELKNEFAFPLLLAHVNHGIRGEEAIRDREFCRETAGRYGLELAVLDADVPSLARESGHGLEETAREVRYAYFERLMKERSIPILLTAHHADDQLETVLFRLCRGTGMRGLCGIQRTRPFADGVLVRPMLQLSREEILEYCRDNRLSYVTDSTNFDTAYARNRLRAEVVPILSELFPQVRRHVALLAEQLREDDAYLEAAASAFLEEYQRGDRICAAELARLPRSVASRALQAFCGDACGTLERVHLDAIHDLIRRGRARARVALPSGMYAILRQGDLTLTRERVARTVRYELPFCQGVTEIPGCGMRITAEKIDFHEKVHNLSTSPSVNLTVCADIINHSAHWRPSRPGEKILLGGMHRELRRLYARMGWEPELRASIPLLCDEEGVLWAPGIGCRDGVCASSGTDAYRLQLWLPEDGSCSVT